MRDPQFYASRLSELGDELHRGGKASAQIMDLASRWQAVSIEAGRLKLETWRALTETTWPEMVAREEEMQPLLDNMRRNDVT